MTLSTTTPNASRSAATAKIEMRNLVSARQNVLILRNSLFIVSLHQENESGVGRLRRCLLLADIVQK
jgi:hypothetical protein